jgi:hypothetical protein
MSKRIRIDTEVLASKYIAQLEADLKLERERLRTARADVEFYRGKCEKLELAVLESSTAGVADSYVRRAEPRRPSIAQTKIETALRPKFQELRRKWDELDANQQEEILKTGEWDVSKTPEVATK